MESFLVFVTVYFSIIGALLLIGVLWNRRPIIKWYKRTTFKQDEYKLNV